MIAALILALLGIQPEQLPQPPAGLLNCGFDARGVYLCRP
jgi:hypothetical protein